MKIDTKGTQTIMVTPENTAMAVGSGMANVFSTPAMIALMEKTAFTSIMDQLEEGQTTVGTLMNVKHLSATPVGLEVRCESRLVEQDGKRLVFEVKAFDPAGCIGEGLHERFIVNAERFEAKAQAKLG